MAENDFEHRVSFMIIMSLKQKRDELLGGKLDKERLKKLESDYNDSKSSIGVFHCIDVLEVIRAELLGGELDEERLKELESILIFVNGLIWDVYGRSSTDGDFFERFHMPEIDKLNNEIAQLLKNKKISKKIYR